MPCNACAGPREGPLLASGLAEEISTSLRTSPAVADQLSPRIVVSTPRLVRLWLIRSVCPSLWLAISNWLSENHRLGQLAPDGGDQLQIRKQRVFRCQFVSLHHFFPVKDARSGHELKLSWLSIFTFPFPPVPTVNSVRREIIDDFQIRVKWVIEGQRAVEAELDFSPSGMGVPVAGNGQKWSRGKSTGIPWSTSFRVGQ